VPRGTPIPAEHIENRWQCSGQSPTGGPSLPPKRIRAPSMPPHHGDAKLAEPRPLANPLTATRLTRSRPRCTPSGSDQIRRRPGPTICSGPGGDGLPCAAGGSERRYVILVPAARHFLYVSVTPGGMARYLCHGRWLG